MVAFCDIGDADAPACVCRLLKDGVGGDAGFSTSPYQNVGGVYAVVHVSGYMTVVIIKFYRHVYGVFRPGDKEDVLKRLLRALALSGSQPLLEQRGEGVAIDDSAVYLRTYDYLTIALQWNRIQSLTLAIPFRQHGELVYVDVLVFVIACKDIVYSQGLIFKEIFKRRCMAIY